MKRLYVVLIILAVSLSFALATGFPLFYRLTYILALALAGSFLWTLLNLRWLEVQVQRSRTKAQVGDRVGEHLTVHNRSFLPKSWLEIQDMTDMPWLTSGMAVGLPGHATRSWRGDMEVRRRGVYTVGPVRVTSGDPFGIFRMQRLFLGQQPLTIYPRTVPLPYLRVPVAEMPGEGSVRRRTQQVTPHASSVREYMHGDSFSRVHWPTTARIGRLMVKEFDLGLGSDVWVFLDLEQRVQAGSGEEATDEYAITIAASLARKYLSVSMPVALLAYGDKRYFLPPERGQGQTLKVLDLLALAKTEGASPFEEVVSLEGARLTRMDTLVAVTPNLEPAWVEALSLLARRGVRVVAILVDPTSFGKEGSSGPVLERLAEGEVLHYLVRRGEVLGEALAHPYGLASLRSAGQPGAELV